jgi:transcription elongation GreA/GreB family factor
MKEDILKYLIIYFQKELDSLKKIAKDSRELATHDEMKKEDKHDTRGEEAKYLAGAQAVRVDELTRNLNILKNAKIIKSNIVSICSLVSLVSDGEESFYFISPSIGGITYKDFQILSVKSPLAQAMISLEKGDDFDLELSGTTKIFEIMSID